MTPNDNNPTGLMMDLRERLVRIETKMDTDRENHKDLADSVSRHEERLKSLEAEALSSRTTVRNLAWAGGAAVTILTLVGDNLTRLTL